MSFYYQCECGDKISKLNATLANPSEDAKDLALYYKGQPIVQCPKCATKYKIKKPSKIIINIALFAGLAVVVALKFTLEVSFEAGLGVIFGLGFIAVVLMIIFNNYFEKVPDDEISQESSIEI